MISGTRDESTADAYCPLVVAERHSYFFRAAFISY